MNQDKEAVKVLAEEIMKAVKVIIEDNNKKYVNNQIKNHGGGSASSLSGSINASQVRNLYSTIGGYIAQAYEKSQDGDAVASAICTAITGLAGIEVKSIAADEAEIGNLYASFGKFINLVAASADIGDLKVKDIRADLATIGLTNIGSAKIKYSQITNLDADTAFIRQGVGDQVYIDNLAVTEGNILALSVGKLMIKDGNSGQMVQLAVDPTTQQVITVPVSFDGEDIINDGTIGTSELHDLAITTSKIANNAVTGDKIIAGSILTKHLDASEIFAKDAMIMNMVADNISATRIFAVSGNIAALETAVITSQKIGDELDITGNSSITLANNYIGLVIDTEKTEAASSLVLTDTMLAATAENIDLSANSSVTARIEDAIENEIITQPEEPEAPENGLIWVDTSQVPNVFKQWNGSTWQLIDGSVLDGNSVLLNKLIQKMSSKISETNDEILLQITREDNAVIEGQVENLSTYISQIDQKAESISLMVGNSTTTFVQNGTPFIQANGDVWMNPDSPDYCIGTIVNNDSNIEFAHDSDGNLLFRYNDGVELHEFQIVENDLMVLYDDEEVEEGYMYQTSEGRVGYWRIIKNVAFSQLDVNVNEISSTVYDQNTGLSAVRQQANKITWLIKSGTSSANMELTDDALSIIANNIDLQANNTVRITSAGQITANAAKNIDLSSNTSIKITAANQITADALNGINLSSNNTVISVAENQAKIAAATKSKVYYQDAQPTGSSFNSGDIWIDTDNNNKLYLWNGSTWVLKRDTSLDYLIDVANGKTTVYYSTTQPASASTGDIWYDISNNLIKRFVGSNWIDITSNALKQALDAAGTAQSTANSKIKTYAQTSAPTNNLITGDLWIDTDDGNKLYRWNGTSWVALRDSHLDYLIDVVDGKTTTYYQANQPSNPEENDIWFDTTNKKIKRYDGSKWNDITNTALYDALEAAGDAQATADGKIKTYSQASAPSSGDLEEGDLWIDTDDGNRLYRWNGSSWIDIRDTNLDYLIDSVDGKSTIYYQTTAPSNAEDNDLWFDTTNKKIKRYSGSTWEDITNVALSDALSAAGDARSIANGKIKTYAQSSAPQQSSTLTLVMGDLWIDTDDNNKLYRWNGTSWVSMQDSHLNYLIDEVDGKTTTYYQTTTPTDADENDLWYDTTNKKIKRFNGNTWEDITDTVLYDALSAANTAQSTANSKIKTYAQTSVPTGTLQNGDLWIDTDDNNKLYRYNGSNWVAFQDSHLDYLVDKVDGKTTTYYQTTTPTDPEENDLWYDTNNHKIKRYTGSEWEDITNNALYDALSAANTAQSTANNKIRTYAQTSVPTSNLITGDLWIDTDDNNKLYRYNGSNWVNVRDAQITTIAQAVEDLQDVIDGKTTVYYQTTAPSNAESNDLWFDTTNKKIKRYSGSSWIDITSTVLADALSAAGDAQATADGKITTYSQTSPPSSSSGLSIGDLWIDTDDNNKLYRWDGSNWIGIRDTHLDYLVNTVNGKSTVYYQSSTPSNAVSGDLWFDSSNNKIKRYNGNSWEDITSSALHDALEAAGDAQTIANGKIKTYAQNDAPTSTSSNPLNYGDLWIDTNDNNKLYRWNNTSWVNLSDSHLDYLIDIVDGKTTTYYQTTAPSAPEENDLWFDTTNNKIKRYNGSSWQDITSVALHDALSAASNAQSTANSKIKTYAQNSAPTSDLKSGDLWIETDNNNKLYRYNGSNWVDVQDSHLDDTVNDLSERVEAAEIVVSNNSIQMTSLKNTFERVITIDTEGLHVGDNQNINNEILIDSDSVNIVTNGQMESKFTGNYIQFGNYQLRRTADGGLAFKLKE